MKIEITSGMNPFDTKILIDGQEAKYVRSIKFEAAVDRIPTVILELTPEQFRINGEAIALERARIDSMTSGELIREAVSAWVAEASEDLSL